MIEIEGEETSPSSSKNKEPPEFSSGISKRSLTGRTLKCQMSTLVSSNKSIVSTTTTTTTTIWNNNECDLPEQQKYRLAQPEIKPTWKRYIILILFCLNAGNKSYQWIQISASTIKATQFFQVENYIINATSFVFMISFVVLSWPACLLIEYIGLRKSILLASFGTALGSIVKCFSCSGDGSSAGIILLMISQILVSLSEQLIYSLPSRLASVWFPDDEVSSAVSVCCLGSLFGVAVGFLVPQYFLNSAHTVDEIGQGFYQMFLWTAGFSVLAFVIDYLLIDEEPEFPPGLARWNQRELELERALEYKKCRLSEQFSSLLKQVANIMTNRDMLCLSLSYGINVGVPFTIITLLDQMLMSIWPTNEQVVGLTGFFFVIFGVGGLLLSGLIMDKWHAYKCINIWLTLGAIVAQVLFAYTLICLQSVRRVYISAALLFTFTSSLIATGLEFSVELTYPASELVTSSLMDVMPQIFGTIFIIIGSHIVDKFGAFETNTFFLICLLLALILLALTREILKRQEAIEFQEQGKQPVQVSSTTVITEAA